MQSEALGNGMNNLISFIGSTAGKKSIPFSYSVEVSKLANWKIIINTIYMNLMSENHF